MMCVCKEFTLIVMFSYLSNRSMQRYKNQNAMQTLKPPETRANAIRSSVIIAIRSKKTI